MELNRRIISAALPAALFAAMLILSACNGDKGTEGKLTPSAEQPVAETPIPEKQTPTEEPTMTPVPSDPPAPTGDIVYGYPDLGTRYEISDSQRKLYDEYVKTLDVNVFKGAAPLDIAMVYIQCGIELQWEAEYNLVNPEGASLTKEEYHAYNYQDLMTLDPRTRKQLADINFAGLKDGKFTDNGDGTGFVAFEMPVLDEVEGTITDYGTSYAYFRQNADGIWLMASLYPIN